MGVHVERAVGGSDVGDARSGEAVDHDRAVLAIAGHVPVEFLGRIERGERGDL